MHGHIFSSLTMMSIRNSQCAREEKSIDFDWVSIDDSVKRTIPPLHLFNWNHSCEHISCQIGCFSRLVICVCEVFDIGNNKSSAFV